MRRHATVRRGFSLLELAAVVTLLAIVVGIATVSLGGVSAVSRLQAAASQVGAVYRLAQLDAARSGLPRMLRVTSRTIGMAKPVHRDGEWVWSPTHKITLVRDVEIRGMVSLGESSDRTSNDPPWSYVLRPGQAFGVVQLELASSNGVRAQVRIDAAGGFEATEIIDDLR